MARIVIDVPDVIADPKQWAKIEQALEGMEPGCVIVEIQHEKYCLAELGKGQCNCDFAVKVRRYE